jgi:hypothetical protein
MLLFPEVASGLTHLSARFRGALFAVPVLAIAFIPALDYHNAQFYSWARLPGSDTNWPYADPLMQPAILAWRVEYAKAAGTENFRASDQLVSVSTDNIFPMTGISRLIYALKTDGEGSREMSARRFLTRWGLADTLIWSLVRAAAAAALLFWIFAAAFFAGKPASRQ